MGWVEWGMRFAAITVALYGFRQTIDSRACFSPKTEAYENLRQTEALSARVQIHGKRVILDGASGPGPHNPYATMQSRLRLL